jgi:uncharacterized protein YwqG/predicted DNA-binding WGR domain protein
MRRFEFAEGSSNKFWEVTVSDNTLTVRFGRIGTPGQEKSKTFPRPELAQKEHDELVAEKQSKGYREVGSAGSGQSGPDVATSAARSGPANDILSELRRCEPLKRVTKQLEALKRDSIRITTAAANKVSLRMCKLGGRPDLPAGISWPTGKIAGREIALPFIAQFDLATVWRFDRESLVPPSGMLYFFYNMADYGADYLTPENWRVIYHGDTDVSYAPGEPPMPIPSHLDYKARAVKFDHEVTLPNAETCYIGGPGNTDAKVELTEDEWDAYITLREGLRANKNIHQMLGHSDDVQPYAMENGYENVRDLFFPGSSPFESLTQKKRYEEYFQGRLLLQIDEEKNIKMQFGRGGRLYFFIREQDLKARDFSKVWVNEQ